MSLLFVSLQSKVSSRFCSLSVVMQSTVSFAHIPFAAATLFLVFSYQLINFSKLLMTDR